MTSPASSILRDVELYTNAIERAGDTVESVVGVAEHIALFFQNLRDRNVVSRARRLRRKSARLYRAAHRIEDRNPSAKRVARLERRAVDAWEEAGRLHSLHVLGAIRLDVVAMKL